jgi:hypothetical protein
VELERAPQADEVSQHVVDDQRRPVVRVDIGLRPDGSNALVVLGAPIAPEPGGLDPKHLQLLFEIHLRASFATRPNRGTDALEENQVRELSPKAFGHFGGEVIVDGLVAAGLVRRDSVAVESLFATTAMKVARRRAPEILDYVMTTALGTETLRRLGRLDG